MRKQESTDSATLHQVLSFIDKARKTEIRTILIKLHQNKKLPGIFDKRDVWMRAAYNRVISMQKERKVA